MPASRVQPATIPVPWPERGLAESDSFHDQQPQTTRDSRNVRTKDPRTGRMRGASRAGHTKLVNSDLTNAAGTAAGVAKRVQNMVHLTYDSGLTTYTNLDGSGGNVPTLIWGASLPVRGNAWGVATDRANNAYVVSGNNTLTKYNPAGEIINTVRVPLVKTESRLGAVDVDIFDGVYVAATTGPSPVGGAVWKYEPTLDGELTLRWTIKYDEGLVGDIAVRNDRLYVLLNKQDTAELIVYDALSSSSPTLVWREGVPYPAVKLAVDGDDSVFVSCDENADRTALTSGPVCSTKSVAWAPDSITAINRWAWFDAYEAFSDLPDGARVFTWSDKSPHGRDLYVPASDANAEPPRVQHDGLCGYPTLNFDGIDDVLVSGRSFSDDDPLAPLSKNMIPAFDNCAFIFAGLFRIDGSGEAGAILGQGGDMYHRLILNVNENGELSPGSIRWIVRADKATGMTGADGNIAEGDYDAGATSGAAGDEAVLVSFKFRGDDVAGSEFRINGEVIDTVQINRDKSDGQTVIGRDIFGTFAGASFGIAEMVVWQGGTGAFATAAEVEQLEGYLCHRWGKQHLLPNTAPGVPHPYNTAPPAGTPPTPPTVDATLFSTQGIVIKYNSAGEKQWAFSDDGVGWGIDVDDEGGVYCVGPTTGTITMRKLIDQGDAVSILAPDGAWTRTDALNSDGGLGGAQVEIAVDRGIGVYVPRHDATGADSILTMNGSDGVTRATIQLPFSSGDRRRCLAVAVDPRTRDFNDSGINEAESLYVVSRDDGGTDQHNQVHKYRLVLAETTQGAPRTTRVITCQQGTVRNIDPGTGFTTPTGAVDGGGLGVVANDPPFIGMTSHFGKVYLADGVTYWEFDPKADTLTEFQATKGEIPERMRLIASYRGRLLIGRGPDPYQWALSAKDDPTDWETLPALPTAKSAVFGADQRIGVCPDIINTFVPVHNDLCLFGCDSTIQVMRGDPRAGGEFDILTQDFGMAYGRSWCRSPDGTIFLFSSRGGLYAMTEQSLPIPLADAAIPYRLRELDLATYTVQLAYNHYSRGVHVYLTPLNPVGAAATREHFFFELDTNAWQVDTFGNADTQPTACVTIDGDDADDRHVLIGTEDGRVLRWDRDAYSDDGLAIDWSVLIGPIINDKRDLDMRFNSFDVTTAREQGSCKMEALFGSDMQTVPDGGTVITIDPGRPRLVRVRGRGRAAFVRLYNTSDSRGFAYENMHANVMPVGRTRRF